MAWPVRMESTFHKDESRGRSCELVFLNCDWAVSSKTYASRLLLGVATFRRRDGGLWPTWFFQLGLRLKLKGRWLRGFHRAEAMVTDGKNDLPDPSGECVRSTRGRGHDDNRQGVLTNRALGGSRQDIATRALMTLGSNRPNPYFVPSLTRLLFGPGSVMHAP